jgi:asparagine synthase (glutamine-hydrolysing)
MDGAEAGPLAAALTAATQRVVGDSPSVTILFSGGLDSSLVAWLARASATVHLVAIGVEGARDLETARDSARRLELPLAAHRLTPTEIERTAAVEATRLAGVPSALWGVLIGMALGLDRAEDPVVLCGQGADELCYGYAHFREQGVEEMRRRAAQDWRALIERDWPIAVELARSRKRDLRSPYLDAEVVTCAQRASPARIGPADPAKPLLRTAARLVGLPAEIAERPKRALQYGTGIERVLRARSGGGSVEPTSSP